MIWRLSPACLVQFNAAEPASQSVEAYRHVPSQFSQATLEGRAADHAFTLESFSARPDQRSWKDLFRQHPINQVGLAFTIVHDRFRMQRPGYLYKTLTDTWPDCSILAHLDRVSSSG